MLCLFLMGNTNTGTWFRFIHTMLLRNENPWESETVHTQQGAGLTTHGQQGIAGMEARV